MKPLYYTIGIFAGTFIAIAVILWLALCLFTNNYHANEWPWWWQVFAIILLAADSLLSIWIADVTVTDMEDEK